MFEITEFTEALLTSVTNRVEKHGDDEKPAVSLGIEIETGNTLLDSIDATLRPSLFKPKDDEPTLPGVEVSMPVLRCNTIDRVTLTTSHDGWRLQLDDKADPDDPMKFGGCKVDKLTVEPKQGGSITLRLRVGTSDVDAERLGALAMRNGGPVWMMLLKPEKAPEKAPVIDGSVEAFKADFPDATDLFAGGDGGGGPPEGEDDEGAAADIGLAEERAEAARGSDGWPFPRGESAGDEQGVDEPETRANAGDAAGAEPAIPDAPKPRARRSKKAAAEVE